MDVLDAPFAKGFIRMASDGWEQGWHERNGGNLSYRIPSEEIAQVRECLASEAESCWLPVLPEEGEGFPDIKDEYFLITGAGRYFRNIALEPRASMGIIQMDGTGCNYRVCWGFDEGGKPTSELPTHFLNHSVKKALTGGANRVVYHAHPVNINALTFVLPHDSRIFTHHLHSMISECAMVFPNGVSVIDWMMPGSLEIGIASSEALRSTDVVIWPHHGMFCTGNTFDEAFGLMHTVEKAAEILVKAISMGYEVPKRFSCISDADIERLK